MEGRFTASSGRMTGSYRERTFTYEVEQINRQNGETVEKDQVQLDDLRDADQVFYKVKGGPDDEEKWRWVAGPYPSQRELEEALEYEILYGSP